jgi:uncharacterized protein YggE
MRNWLLTSGLAGGALCFFVLSLPGQTDGVRVTDDSKDTISTSGSATIRTKPDSARVFFGVQTVGKTIKQAREENNRKVKQVMDALAELKIPDLKMKTDNVNVELLQSGEQQSPVPEVRGYRVTNSMTVLVSNPDSTSLSTAASRVLDTALETGVNFVHQIVFFKLDDASVKRLALTNAVQDARANANALAEGANVQILAVHSIEGQPDYRYAPTFDYARTNVALPGAVGEATHVVAGDLEITCHVRIRCTFGPRP